MKRFSFFVAAFALICFASCGSKRSQAYYEKPSQVLSANYDGSYVIRVQVRAKDAVIAFTDGQRKAVEEVIFKGVKAGTYSITETQAPAGYNKLANPASVTAVKISSSDDIPSRSIRNRSAAPLLTPFPPSS